MNDLRSSNATLALNQDPYADPNKNYDILHNHIVATKNKHIPTTYVKFNKHKGNKWITKDVMRSIKYKDKLYCDLKGTSNSSPNYNELKRKLNLYSKLLKTTIQEAKTQYYTKQFQNYKLDIGKPWGVISEILSKKQSRRNSIKSVVTDRHIISDNKIIAEKFNNFFHNAGPTLAAPLRSNVSRTHKSYLNENILTSFQFNLADEDHIGKIMKSLKNKTSSGHYGISVKLLIFLSPALVKPLSLIINQSLITGIFPEKLKRPKVLPLFKKGDETLIKNYCPVSLLTSISKVFEKVVFIQLSKYFQDNGLFYESQYGFRENHSTELATVELLDRIMSALDHKELPIYIYIWICQKP